MRSRSRWLCALGGAFALVTAALACTTSDPRAGRDEPKGNAPPPSSGGSGIDASLPEGALECGAAPGVVGAFTKAALLDAAASCAAWHVCTFVNAASSLQSAVREHAAAPSDTTRVAARMAWTTAMNEWAKMEMFQFGPLASKVADRYHGRGLRTFVHPWPDLNRCQVETQVVSKAYEKGWDAVFPSSRGLFALEYVFFYEGADTACLANSTTAKTWGTIDESNLALAKSQYAAAVADNVVALALEMRNVWLPEGENFKAKLAAFEGYGSEQETLNVVAWALFYPEKEIKDFKIAPLAGVRASSPTRETPFATVDIENIRTNLRTWRELFQGCSADGSGIGFDDWLVAAGHAQLAADLLAALATAQQAADTFPSFATATEEQFLQLHGAIKPLSDLLKTSLFGSASPLNLKLPASAASDTD